MKSVPQTAKSHILHVETYGRPQNPQVILLHGIATNHTIWKRLIADLQVRHYVVALDLLGHGRSPKPTDVDYTADRQAQAIYETLASHKLLRPSTVVGFSIGALIAARFAVWYPELVTALVLTAPPVYQPASFVRGNVLDRSYDRIYKAFLRLPRRSTLKTLAIVQRRAPKLMGKNQLNEQTWHPVLSSLEHTVQAQALAQDIQQLARDAQLSVLYGAFDHLVIAGRVHEVAGSRPHTHIQKVWAPHSITGRYEYAIRQVVCKISQKSIQQIGSL